MRDSPEHEIPHIKFKDVSFSYPGEKENLIFKCNFSIKKPGFWMVVGKNGSGKSTLLKLINGIIKPQHGSSNRIKFLLLIRAHAIVNRCFCPPLRV